MMESESNKNVPGHNSQKGSRESIKEKVCDLLYLNEMVRGNKRLIKEIIDEFLTQVPEELEMINEAVSKEDYPIIKNVAHTMKSSLSIMGISVIIPVLQSIEELSGAKSEIGRIRELSVTLNAICNQVIEELEGAKHNYD